MTTGAIDNITADEAGTLAGLFRERVRRTPGAPACRQYNESTGQWEDTSWAEMGAQVSRWQVAMSGEDLQPGDRVAILLRNCREWVMFDQAALGCGLVVVPLYTDDRPENIAYILKEADVEILLVQDAGRWRRLSGAIPKEGALKRILLLDDGDTARKLAVEDERIRIVSDWLPEPGGQLITRDNADGGLLASIVYTSGTTGRPKGVMLSHLNMMSVAHG